MSDNIRYAEPGYFEWNGRIWVYGPSWCVLVGYLLPEERLKDAIARIEREERQ